MRTRSMWLAGVLVGALVLTPAVGRAQTPNIGESEMVFPWPLGPLDHAESGPYLALEAMYWRMNNPLQSQVLAVRGFVDDAGQVTGDAGRFIGTRQEALNTRGMQDNQFEPGFRISIGYRFHDHLVLEFSYWKLDEFRHFQSAGILGVGLSGGDNFADSFLHAPFYNFPTPFAGSQNDVSTAAGGFPLFGIWNGAENMSVEFVQRIWNAELNLRVPCFQNGWSRQYVISGLRYMPIYERFRWRTEDADLDGAISPLNVATYSFEWENRLYGAQFGWGSDCYLGGGIAFNLDAKVGVAANVRRSEAKIERGDDLPPVAGAKTDNDFRLAPYFNLGAFIQYYPPWGGMQFRVGYEYTGIFNALRSPHPAAFNVGNLDPELQDEFIGLDGFSMGVAFIF